MKIVASVLVANVLLLGNAVAREIPVTKALLRSGADAVFVGVIEGVRISRVDTFVLDVEVVDKVFDRNRNIAQRVTVNGLRQPAHAPYAKGQRLLFVTATCENGSQVLLGRQFVVPVNEHGRIDTAAWEGFSGSTEVRELKDELTPLRTKDDFLATQLCQAIADGDPASDNSVP